MLKPRAGLIVGWRQRHQQSEVSILTSTLSKKDREHQSNMIADYLQNIIRRYLRDANLHLYLETLCSLPLSTTKVRHRIDVNVNVMTD